MSAPTALVILALTFAAALWLMAIALTGRVAFWRADADAVRNRAVAPDDLTD